MSEFARKTALARRRTNRRWMRGLRLAGDVGLMLTGAAGLWMFAVVVLS